VPLIRETVQHCVKELMKMKIYCFPYDKAVLGQENYEKKH